MSTSDDQKPPSNDGGSEDDRVEHSGERADMSTQGSTIGPSGPPPADPSGPDLAASPASVPEPPGSESADELADDDAGGDESTVEASPVDASSADSASAAPVTPTGPEQPATRTDPGDAGTGEPVQEPRAEPEGQTEASPKGDTSSSPEPSANPLTSMLGSVNEARSWLLELPDFDGPLDLLLHLVRRHELDILDIPISFVTEKYLEYLAFMQALDLEVAGDYLVMAATLAYLKSRELVPTEPTEVSDEGQSDDEGPDPREELIARLLEYQKYRAAASDLDGLPIQGRDVFSRGGRIELPPVDPGLAPLTLFRLAEAYNRVLDRARIHKSHDVVLETVSVAQRMNQLTSMLIEQERVEFEGLFLGRSWNSESELRSMLVVTLMSVLELTKLGVIFVHQDTANGAIVIERKATPEEAKQAIADYDENISFGKVKPGVAEASASGEAASSSDDPQAPEAPESDAEPDSDV